MKMKMILEKLFKNALLKESKEKIFSLFLNFGMKKKVTLEKLSKEVSKDLSLIMLTFT
jgi:hypothetical protein